MRRGVTSPHFLSPPLSSLGFQDGTRGKQSCAGVRECQALQVIIPKLQDLDDARKEIVELLEEVKEQEQEALDNMPDSLQDSERGQQIEDNVTNLEYAVDFLDEWDVEEITDLLQTVIDA